MITSEFTEIKISKKNIEHFIQFYKDIKLKDIIKVDPTKLQKSSNVKIDVRCDVCNINRRIKYQAYYKNINSCEEFNIYTCDKCSHIKIKSFNRNKYGVDYFSQTPEYIDKFKKTMLERFGVEHALQSEDLKNKVKKTNLEKFGYENPFMDYNRISEMFNDKYGVDHPSKVDKFNDKIKKTNLDKFGYESALSSPEIREKINNTNLERHGGHPMKSDEMRYLKMIITRDKDYISYISDNISLFSCEKGHRFQINSDLYHNRLRSNITLCTVCYPIGDSRSIKEDELYDMIRSIYEGEIVKSYRDGLEIDIYLPDLKLGFEFNGLYFHSSKFKEKNYHLDKTNYFKDRGIRIIHIWEDDWDNKIDILSSQISGWLGKTKTKIFARKCKVVELSDVNIIRSFINNSHIQGVDKSVVKLGLTHNNELVSVMTFNNSEGRKKMENGGWNLSRFCNKLDVSVIGGASKLLKYFINNYNPTRIVSYADRDWSNGNLYYQLGFKNIGESKQDYKYIINNKRVNKSRYRKSKLKTDLSESEFMSKSGIDKVYDCGKIKFELFIQ